ncbi:MAG: hypothetical protein AB1589_01100 [Cyanobacteriota bacterium]
MPKEFTSYPIWSILGLAVSISFASIGQFYRYLGLSGVVFYLIIVVLIAINYLFISKFIVNFIVNKYFLWLVLMTFAILAIAFIVIYPIANSGVVGGGSDREEALNLAATELLSGRYPYYVKTYLGGPISPLPGAVFLSIPFVLLGNSAYQNFFWLFTFLVSLKFYLGDERLALLLLWGILALSPEVMREFLTGGDGVSVGIYILVFILFVIDTVPHNNKSLWKKILASALLGIGLSSRPQIIFLLPLIFSMLVQRAGWKTAIQYTSLSCAIAGAITIPFYLYDPQGFSPLNQASKLSQFHSVLPYVSVIIPLLTGMIAICLSFQRMDRRGTVLLRNCAFVQAFPVICTFFLSILRDGEPGWGILSYGIYFLFFGAIACWVNLSERMTSVFHNRIVT